jgi:hypothetical protein
MWPRRILIACIGLLAGLFDATVAVWFGGPLAAINMALPLVVLLSAFSSLERSLTAAVAAGLVIDVLQPSFGLVTLRLLVVAGVIRAVSQAYVTNRSLIGSLALGVIGVALDRALLWLFTLVRGFSSTPFVHEVPPPLIPAIIWTSLVMLATFLIFVAFTRRFMPLISRR